MSAAPARTTQRQDAGDIARMLAGSIDRLAAQLLPAGRRHGREWQVGSLAGERGASLSVCLSGTKAGVWKDFASNQSGDALDLVAAVIAGGDRGQALCWSRAWLGLEAWTPQSREQVAAGPTPEQLAERAQRDARTAEAVRQAQQAALKMWLAAPASLAGSPAAGYLAARGIDLARLGRQPSALRCHPSLWNTEASRHYPALVAAISGADGVHVATHRTWLQRDGDGVWRKAPLEMPKKVLGAMAGGSIRIQRGGSGRALAAAPDGDTVAIAEGIETALSVAIACPELRVLSSVSLGNMAAIALPAAIATVVLCADHDTKPQPQAALARAVERYKDEGRAVRVARPSRPGADWNDVLLASMARA